MENKIASFRRKAKTNKKEDAAEVLYVNELEEKLKLLQRENKELESLVSLLQDDEVVTFQDGRYCDEVREVIMDLLSLNVSMSKVNDVIRVVLNKLAGKKIDRLPSNAVKSRLLIEARYLSQSHVAEAMIADLDLDSGKGNCLHGDGTTKYHRHYQNFQITLKDGRQLSMGLKEMAGGDTAAEMQAFTEIIEDLADTVTNNTDDCDRGETIANLIGSIKSTMSDHGPTNPCFNRKLQVLRETLIPTIHDKWDYLDEPSKESISGMCNFFCKMHLLPNLATESDKTIKLFQEICTGPTQQTSFTNESGAARLVRTAAKAFHPRGCDEAGVAAYFQSFLQGKGKKLQIISYNGSRFNVLFYDAAATYFHRNEILQFLKSWPNPNKLLLAVLEDISNPVNVACVRALGIIDKTITGPFWRLIESKQSILELNPYLHQMKISFERWSRNGTDLFEGEVLFSDVEVHKDDLYEALFETSEENELDTITIQCLELLMHAFLLILERQAEDQLPGGQYFEPTDNIKRAATNVPTTNKVSEKEFASLDLLVRTKPSSKVISHEALVMWSHNETRQWLDEKDEDEKASLLKHARQGYESAMIKYRERKEKLKMERMEKLLKKQQEKEKTRMKKHTLKVNSTNELIKTGNEMWTTEEEISLMLDGMSEKEKKANLLAQIKFHKNVLKSKGQVRLFALSTTINGKRKQYTAVDLENNLKEILTLNPVCSEVAEPEKVILVPAEKRQEKFEDTKRKLLSNLVQQRLKQKVTKSKIKLTELTEDPEKLVGIRVKHKCVTDNGAVWFDGVVTKLKKKDGTKTEFMVRYDEDDDDVQWMFPLLKDLQRGDLILSF